MKAHFDKAFKRNVNLAGYTTFRIGGPASFFTTARSSEEVEKAVRASIDQGIPWKVIGEGSNILASDDGINAAIIAYADGPEPILQNNGDILVSGGTRLKNLLSFCTAHSLSGVERLAGIPGTVGGAIAGNAGAYGMCIADVVKSVRLLGLGGIRTDLAASEMNFEYRSSRIKYTGEVVLETTLNLSRGDPQTIQSEISRVLEDRQSKHPDYNAHPTAGSFFKNLPPLKGQTNRRATGELLEQIGAKELRVGGAGLWHKHANIVINYGDATAHDVKALTDEMARRVHDRFGVTLEPEVTFLD